MVHVAGDLRLMAVPHSPTAAGQQALADGRAQTAAIDDLITRRLTPGEMTDLARMLRKLLDNTPGGHAMQKGCPPGATAPR